MNLKALTPNLMVESVSQTVEFYKEVLGFELVMTLPEEGVPDWALVRSAGVEMMFQSQASMRSELPSFQNRPVGGSLTLYIQMEDVQEFHARLQEKGIAVEDLNTTFYGMREFRVPDCNGYMLVFAQQV